MKYGLNKLKTLLVAIAIIFVGFIVAWFRFFGAVQTEPGSNNVNTTTTAPGQTAKINVGIDVDYGNGKVISYDSLEVNNGETAYSLLVKKMQEKNVTVKTKTYDYGTMVQSIDNIEASATNYWAYSVNGQAGSVAADKYVLKNGDLVEWKYTPLN